jgi:hypothetical protein
MSTGRFNENFNSAEDLPNADLPRDTFEDIAAREALEDEQDGEE